MYASSTITRHHPQRRSVDTATIVDGKANNMQRIIFPKRGWFDNHEADMYCETSSPQRFKNRKGGRQWKEFDDTIIAQSSSVFHSPPLIHILSLIIVQLFPPLLIMKVLTAFLTFATSTFALSLTPNDLLQVDVEGDLLPRQAPNCRNTPTSRDCWGRYNVDTDYYVRPS